MKRKAMGLAIVMIAIVLMGCTSPIIEIIQSANADLATLTVDSGTLSPVFAAATTAYTVTVANTVTSLIVSGTKADTNASVSAAVTLSDLIAGVTQTATITVTAQNGATKSYTVVATRAPAIVPEVNLIFDGSSKVSKNVKSIVPSSLGAYSGYGSLVSEMTPTSFVLPLIKVMMFSDKGSYDDQGFVIKDLLYKQVADETFYANFLLKDGISYQPQVVSGTFNYLFVYLDMNEGGMTYGDGTTNYSWSYQSDISFDLPIAYQDIELSQYSLAKTGTTVKFTDGGQLQDRVFLDTVPSYLYIFGETSSAEIYNSEGATVDLRDVFNQGPGLPVTNAPVIRGPFEPITIPEEFTSLTVTFNFDLTNVIQLYDNNTPELLADDILVLAPEYWNRMSVSCSLVE